MDNFTVSDFTVPLSPNGTEKATFEYHVIFACAITVITSLIIVSNILNIVIISRTPQLKNSSGHLLIQLSCVDLLSGIFMGIFAIPSSLYERWIFPQWICTLCGYFGSITFTLSVNTIALVSLDRCLYISKPLHYKFLVTKWRTWISIVIAWILNIIWYSIPFCVPSWDTDMTFHYWEGAYLCTVAFESNFVFFMLSLGVMFVPSTIVIFTCHVIMYLISRQALQKDGVTKIYQMRYKKQWFPKRGEMYYAESQRKNIIQNNQAFKTVATILIAFIIAWLPKLCYSLAITIERRYSLPLNLPPLLAGVAWWIAVSNSYVNFFIYSYRNKAFRRNAKILLKHCIWKIPGDWGY